MTEVRPDDFEREFHETRASVTLELEREYEDMVKTLRQDSPTRQGIGFVQ
ncbi:hypothetical protein GGQ64_004947 [Rhizobium azooxidifex]|uniref:Uncharacterized protein n=1 Tax=Mycoplana azooxidifex TaxID=1636188 RepID=A0A7W6DBN5_9HYPH|nr:hypothetical protein [Mycoplana azooxidifex]